MELIDYSDFYFRTKLREALPPQRAGKFVLVNNIRGAQFILQSPKALSAYHADIVRLFCNQRGIEGIYNNELKYFEIHDDQWKVGGGGKWSIDDTAKTMRLWGYSQAYGRFNHAGLKESLSTINALSDYEITIDT
ncbi:MAG: hypothetical protein HQK97_12725 [Nitrospirae bacterium]|nr:hypothetical protein [Nitrospirota bacterium]